MAERRAWLGALLVLALLIALVELVGPGPQVQPLDLRLSTVRSTPDGVRGLYLALPALGIPVARRITPLVDADSITGPLALLAPAPAPSPRELRALRAWLARGGNLIYAASYQEDATLDTLGLPPVRPITVPATPRRSGARSRDRVVDDLLRGERLQLIFSPKRGGRYTPWRTLLQVRDSFPVVLEARIGKGRVLAVSDPAALSNAEVRLRGVGPLVASFAAQVAGPGRPLVFDEYHHGLRGGSVLSGLAAVVRRFALEGTLLQLALVLLLVMLVAARRLGAPLPEPGPQRRSPLEHVDALAGAYRAGRARRLPRLLLLGGLARRLGRPRPRSLGEAEELLARVAGGRPSAAPLTRDLARALHDPDAELGTIARGIDRVLGEIRR